MDYEKTSKAIRTARIAAGYTQAQVAELLGKAQTTVAAWETGRAMPPAPMIIELAKLYAVSSDYLLGLSEHYSVAHREENVPSRYFDCIKHLCTAVEATIAYLAEYLPQLLPNADDCIYAAIDCFCGLSDSFLDAIENKVDPSQYKANSINEITKMVICFYDYYDVTNQVLERISEKKNSTDD